MICPNCKSEASVLLIDCALPFGPERDRIRYCAACRPEANGPCHHPRAIHFLPENEQAAAWARRRYAKDRLGTYKLEERLSDLLGALPTEILQ